MFDLCRVLVLQRGVRCLPEDGLLLRPLHVAHSHHLWHQHRLYSFWWVSLFIVCTICPPAKPQANYPPPPPLSLNPSLPAWSPGCHPGCGAVPGDVLGSGAGGVRPVAGAGRRRQGRADADLPSAPHIFCRYSNLLWYLRVCMCVCVCVWHRCYQLVLVLFEPPLKALHSSLKHQSPVSWHSYKRKLYQWNL